MGELAQRLPCPYQPNDLIVPPRVQAELDLALAWVRYQVKVLGQWGFEQRVPFGYGLSALFSGPSGTGKTMAAQVLAKQLDLDLYRVDLSRVVSKYIGETEKNLGQLFDESHRSGAILFFDEADALFGKRSEVKDAHDRYANVEIGYLLQRMEEHDGIVILATNRKQDMDEAFTRRFDIIVSFPMPDEAHRLRIWEGMFPPTAAREELLEFGPLAHKFELSGGEIRNVVLAAAYLAANEGHPITMRHLKQALIREQRKSGRVIDEKAFEAL
jgi:SpoVK/Ycf46/Vps4 family AAA+-type ATPase